jgi:hypothetical protein
MAAFVGSVTGNWNVAATWGGAGVPASGDTVTINASIVVSVTDARTVGTLPASTATQVQVNGTLQIQNGGTLIVRGSLACGAAGTLDVQPGGIYEVAPSATVQYLINGGTAGGVIKASGAVAADVATTILRTQAGGLNALIEGSRLQLDFCTVLRMGDATNIGIDSFANSATDYWRMRNMVLDTCGQITFDSTPAAATPFELTLRMKNSQAANPFPLNTGTASTATIRKVSIIFDKAPTFIGGLAGCDFVDCYFADGWSSTAAGAGSQPNSWKNNCVVLVTADAVDPIADATWTMADTYWILRHDGHFQGAWAGGTADGHVFECDITTGIYKENDCFGAGAGYAGTFKMQYCIALPNSADPTATAGCIGSMLGNATTKQEVRHCTMHLGSQGSGNAGGGTGIGETFTGAAGMLPVWQDNLCWTDTANGGCGVNNIGGASTIANLETAAGIRNNHFFNAATGTGGVNGYNRPTGSTGVIGANDSSGDPQFVDKTRNIKKWDTSLGGLGTVANALTELQKRYEAGYNSAYTISALLAYIRKGFAPKSTTVRGTASDGGDKGAVLFEPGSPPMFRGV